MITSVPSECLAQIFEDVGVNGCILKLHMEIPRVCTLWRSVCRLYVTTHFPDNWLYNNLAYSNYAHWPESKQASFRAYLAGASGDGARRFYALRTVVLRDCGVAMDNHTLVRMLPANLRGGLHVYGASNLDASVVAAVKKKCRWLTSLVGVECDVCGYMALTSDPASLSRCDCAE